MQAYKKGTTIQIKRNRYYEGNKRANQGDSFLMYSYKLLFNGDYNKKLALAFALALVCSLSFAQDPMFSQFMFKQLYFNPANAGTTSSPRLMGGYRNQWPGMNNAFSTYYLTYDQNIPSIKSGVGFSVLRDVMGNSTLSVTGFDLNYNYQAELSNKLNVAFGISAGMYQKFRNTGNLVLPDQSPYPSPDAGNSPPNTGNNHEFVPSDSRWYPDFGFGIQSLYKKRHWVSFALHHLNKPNVSINNETSRYPIRFTFQYVTEFHQYVGKFTEKTMIYKPGIIYQQQGRYNYISFGGNIEYNPLIYGVWVRNDNNFSVESLILLVGYSVSNLKFVYSYDMRLINFSKNVINNGAHEVTFQLDFKYNERKKMRQVKCPKF